jgi:PemK-like, MazF-like toxin of type II toxin-antitoxin system
VSVTPTQGEVWWAEAQDKRRPVLIVTRSDAVPVLTWIIVAPVTRTIREIPTEVRLGPSHGLPEGSRGSPVPVLHPDLVLFERDHRTDRSPTSLGAPGRTRWPGAKGCLRQPSSGGPRWDRGGCGTRSTAHNRLRRDRGVQADAAHQS